MEEKLIGLKNKDKRKRELIDILTTFDELTKGDYPDSVININDACDKILIAYGIILTKVIKELIKKDAKAQIYKVVSGLELACIYVSPYKTQKIIDDEHINVLLANHIAFSFLGQEIYSEIPDFFFKNSELIKSLTVEHLDFLKYISSGSQLEFMPVFSNSTYWRAISYILELNKK